MVTYSHPTVRSVVRGVARSVVKYNEVAVPHFDGSCPAESVEDLDLFKVILIEDDFGVHMFYNHRYHRKGIAVQSALKTEYL